MKAGWTLILGVAAISLLAGCGSTSTGVRVMDTPKLARPRVVAPPDVVVDVYWKLLELDGQPAPLGSGGKEAHLLLQPDKPFARGFAGCNRFTGEYELAGDRLSFHRLTTTRMACAEGMQLEADYLRVLDRVAGWSRTGDRLALSDAEGVVIARFVARPL